VDVDVETLPVAHAPSRRLDTSASAARAFTEEGP
jgi:hypothetical protein